MAYTFTNLLPFPLRIYAFKFDKLDLVGSVPARGKIEASKTITGLILGMGIDIHITYSPKGVSSGEGPEYEIIEPITLVADSKNIRIGDVTYKEITNTLVQRSHSDISGIRVHNKTILPVRIYHKGLRLALVHPGDGTTFQSGSEGSVYINNDTRGFNIGDELELKFVFTSKKSRELIEVPWCTITINDNYASDFYIGTITQHINIPIQDAYSYRLGSPNISNLKYISAATSQGLAYNTAY